MGLYCISLPSMVHCGDVWGGGERGREGKGGGKGKREGRGGKSFLLCFDATDVALNNEIIAARG